MLKKVGKSCGGKCLQAVGLGEARSVIMAAIKLKKVEKKNWRKKKWKKLEKKVEKKLKKVVVGNVYKLLEEKKQEVSSWQPSTAQDGSALPERDHHTPQE